MNFFGYFTCPTLHTDRPLFELPEKQRELPEHWNSMFEVAFHFSILSIMVTTGLLLYVVLKAEFDRFLLLKSYGGIIK